MILVRSGARGAIRRCAVALAVGALLASGAGVITAATPTQATTAAPASSPPDNAARARAFAALPYWGGYWQTPWARTTATVSGRTSGMNFLDFLKKLPTMARPPLLPAEQAKYDAALADTAARQAEFVNFKGCGIGIPSKGYALPFIFEAPMVFQVVITPEETLFVFDHGEVRHVFTDGRPVPPAEDLWPTSLGFSTGRWNGQVLEITTVGRAAGPVAPQLSPVILSESAHFTERLRRIDANTLEDEMTIVDPQVLSEPWKVTFRFEQVPGLDRLIPFDCSENDRNPLIDGKLTHD
jgi:hypothetical protein